MAERPSDGPCRHCGAPGRYQDRACPSCVIAGVLTPGFSLVQQQLRATHAAREGHHRGVDGSGMGGAQYGSGVDRVSYGSSQSPPPTTHGPPPLSADERDVYSMWRSVTRRDLSPAQSSAFHQRQDQVAAIAAEIRRVGGKSAKRAASRCCDFQHQTLRLERWLSELQRLP